MRTAGNGAAEPGRSGAEALPRPKRATLPAGAELAIVASTAHRLAVLLAAGVAPSAAWGYLDSQGSPFISRVAARVATGSPVPGSILVETSALGVAVGAAAAGARERETAAWSALAAAWHVATEAGAPLSPTLRHVAGSLRSLADAQREVQTALSAPAATARMVMALPAVGVLFAMLLGFDPLGTLLTSPPGLGCLVAGLGMLLAARHWNARLVEQAQPSEVTPGLLCELTAIAVSGGASLERARASVDAALEACRIRGAAHAETGVVTRIIELSRRAGVPAGELLRGEAEEQRRLSRAEAARRAAVLSVRLMLPLGACVLPAFMLLGVAPLLISVISSTVGSF